MLKKAKIKLQLIIFITFIAVQVAFSQFRVYIPRSEHPVVPGKQVKIYFDNPTNYAIDLYYSTDNGTSWHTIARNIRWNYYEWTIPFFEELHFHLKATLKNYSQPEELFSIYNAHSGEIRSLNFHQNSRYLLSSANDNKIKIWDVWNKVAIDSLELPSNRKLYNAIFTNNGFEVIFALDSSIYYWSAPNTYTEIAELKANGIIRALAINNTNEYLAVGSYDGKVKLYDLPQKKVIGEYTTKDTLEIYCVRFSKDSRYIGSSGWKGLIEVWDWQNNTKVAELKGHGDVNLTNLLVWTFDFSNDNKYIASGGIDKTNKYWNIAEQKLIYSISNHFSQIRAVKFYPNGNYFLSAGLDSLLYQYEAEDGTQIGEALKARFSITSAEYSQTGDTIAAGGRYNTITFWKNFQAEEISDTILVNIQYPAVVQILNIEGEAGDKLPIALTTQISPYLANNFRGSYQAELEITAPEDFLYFSSFENPHIIKKGKDTIKINIANLKFGDTLIILSSILKPSKNEFGSIKIIDFKLQNPTPFNFEKYDGTIRLLDRTNNPEIKIYPNPVHQFVKVDIIIYKRGSYSLELYDDRGALVTQFFCDDFERGFYEFYYDLSALSSSAYYFVYNRLGDLKIIPIVVVR